MRLRILVLLMLLGVATAAPAQVNIGINISLFPELVRVPDYPVYYAPRQNANYFFYDGLYWVFQNDEWYSSDWYNGPWYRVAPEYVPVYVLRIPVRYYRRPPPYFGGWQRNAPPRWGEHWGRDWEQRRGGWDRWNRSAAPAPAPLPTYQRKYSGDRYPRVEERHEINNKNYRYAPRDSLVREHVRPQIQAATPPSARPAEPQRRDAGKDGRDRGRNDANDRAQRPSPASAPVQRSEPMAQPRPPAVPDRKAEQPSRDAGRDRERDQRTRPASPPAQRSEPTVQPTPRPQPQAAPPREQPQRPEAAPPREQQPRPQRQDSAPPGKGGGHEQGKGQDKGQERSRGKGDDK